MDMLRGEFDAGAAADPAALRADYESRLADTIDRVGLETVAERSGLPQETLAAVGEGDAEDLSLSAAAAIFAADEDRPDAETVAAEARDILLLGMTTAVLDVDTLASTMDGAMEAKDLHQKVEGRQPMTIAEYAQIHHTLGEHAE